MFRKGGDTAGDPSDDLGVIRLPLRVPVPARTNRQGRPEWPRASPRCGGDLLDLRQLSTVMRSQVVSTARLLLDRDPTARAFFETFVYSSYARLNEERLEILEQVKREGRIHG